MADADRKFVLMTKQADGMYGLTAINPPVFTWREALKAAREHIISSGSRETIAIIQDTTNGKVIPVNQLELDHPNARLFASSSDSSCS